MLVTDSTEEAERLLPKVAGFIPMNSEQSSAIPKAATSLLHDARAVHDVASLQFASYQFDGHPVWVLAVVTPRPDSGAARVPGSFTDVKTGRTVTPAGASTVVVKDGTWKVLASVGKGHKPLTNEYAWSEPFGPKQTLTAEDYYSPFVSGGIILFRPVSGASGVDQFGPVCLLFQDWEPYVRPAFDFAEQHPSLFLDGKPALDNTAQPTELLSGPNELLTVWAFRQLLLSGQMSTDRARQRLADSSGYLAAILTYLLLTAPMLEGKTRPAAQEILAVIERSPELAKVQSVSLGCFAAGLIDSSNPDTLSMAQKVLTGIRRRLKGLGPSAEGDRYLGLIFEKMAIQ